MNKDKNDRSEDYTLKILVLGDPTAEKEELLKKYATSIFREDLELNLTLSVDFFLRTTEFDGESCKLQLWNFRGEERFRYLYYPYSKGADGVIFLYDITDSNGLKHIPEWVQIIRENAWDIPILLVGNNLDVEQNRRVSKKRIEKLKKKYDVSSIEISVKTGENVEKMFLMITEMIYYHDFPRIKLTQEEKDNKIMIEKKKIKLLNFLNSLKWYALPSVGIKQPSSSDDQEYDYKLKIVLYGEPQFALTALTKKFCYNIFSPSELLTTGVDFHVKTIELNGRRINLQIWDVEGEEEKFKFLLPTYLLGTDGIIVIYQTKKIREIIELVRKNAGDIPIFFAIPDLLSSRDLLTEKYPLTEITHEVGLRGENAFILLTKKIFERFEWKDNEDLIKQKRKEYKDKNEKSDDLAAIRKIFSTKVDGIFKILILGDASSGREELLKKYATLSSPEDTLLTLGVSFYLKIVSLKDKKIRLSLWYMREEERFYRFQFLLSQYSKGANGAFVLYDITDSNSLKYVPEWIQKIRENTGEIPILLVGNKLDVEQNREVSKEQIEKLKKQYDISSSIEISAKTGENVEKMFLTITKMILKKETER